MAKLFTAFSGHSDILENVGMLFFHDKIPGVFRGVFVWWYNEVMENSWENQNSAGSKEQAEKEKLYAVAKRGLGGIFKTYPSGRERIDYIKAEVVRMADHFENSQQMLEALEECVGIEDKREFVEKTFAAAKPLIDMKIEDPQIFIPENEADREFIPINEALCYEDKGDNFEIHIIPKEVMGNVTEKIMAGFSQMAELVAENEKINAVTAESWIVAKHPKIAEKFGFKIDDSEKGKAHMERSEFLEKYLKK